MNNLKTFENFCDDVDFEIGKDGTIYLKKL